MINILFIAHVDSYYSAFIGLATSLGRKESFSPTFLFPRPYPNVRKHIHECSMKGISFKTSFALVAGATPRTYLSKIGAFTIRVALALFRLLPGVVYASKLADIKARMISIRYELIELSPSVIILGGDIVGHDMALYIRVGHDLGIPSLILPGWMASAREPAELQLYNPDYSLRNPMNWVFCHFFPRWHFHHKGRDLIRLPAQEALALETLGLAPPMPWILHSGFVDVIGVESKVAREYGLREGLPPQRLIVTGSHTHDVLFEGIMERNERRAALYDQLDLNPYRPLVVCALPPDMLYGKGGRPDCEFLDYRTLVAGFLEPIHTQLGSHFLLCLHPSAKKDQLSFVADYGAILVEESLAELLPLADIYVASISATIQWAVACSIPVINYDVYNYSYTDYQGLDGVLTLKLHSEYVDALTRMIDEPSFLAARSADQSLVAASWGLLDGKATERICDLLHDLAELKAGEHSYKDSH
jgi:hypothetical protein